MDKTIHLVTVDVDLGYQVWSAWLDKKDADAEVERLYLLDLAWNPHTERKNYGVESIVIGVQDHWRKAVPNGETRYGGADRGRG